MEITKMKVIGVLLAAALALAGCGSDPHECGPNDRDGDGDGRCNE